MAMTQTYFLIGNVIFDNTLFSFCIRKKQNLFGFSLTYS